MDTVGKLNSYVIWGLPMVILMLGTGLFLNIVTGGVIFRRFGTVMRYTLLTLLQKKEKKEAQAGRITPFQALCTALAATVGTGNVVGVALAIATGGPGAVFWLWVCALLGMGIKYSEVTLSVAYRQTNAAGEAIGGPMYYISRGLGMKWLAVLFSVFGAMAAFGIGAMVQANSLASGVNAAFGLPGWTVGLAAALLAAAVVIGGIRRIAAFTQVLVPFMALFYIVGAVAVLIVNAAAVPAALGRIFRDAFTGTAATGGFLGASVMYACRVGMARGVFTHEAGMGSAPIAHACAATDHPARQGLWGAFEVFVDSIVVCTLTALVILTSGLWCAEPQLPGATMSAAAFQQAIPGGQYIVTFGMLLFAFATIIAWHYYGAKCVEYLFGSNRVMKRAYQLTYILLVFAGSVLSLDAVWEIADLFNGLMAIPNLIALIALAPVVRRLSRDFFADPHRIRPSEASWRCLVVSREKEDPRK